MIPKSLKVDEKALIAAFDGDKNLVLFFLTYIKNGKNGVKAYQELHPNTDYGTAGVLASRLLKKVRIEALLEVYGAGFDAYFSQLAEGHRAEKWNEFSGDREPDHKVREGYNKRIGKLLGVETDEPTIAIQTNVSMGLLLENYKDEKV